MRFYVYTRVYVCACVCDISEKIYWITWAKRYNYRIDVNVIDVWSSDSKVNETLWLHICETGSVCDFEFDFGCYCMFVYTKRLKSSKDTTKQEQNGTVHFRFDQIGFTDALRQIVARTLYNTIVESTFMCFSPFCSASELSVVVITFVHIFFTRVVWLPMISTHLSHPTNKI